MVYSQNKPVIYMWTLVMFENWRNREQVYEMSMMIELEIMYTSITKNPYNLDAHLIIKIFLVLCSTHMVSKDQKKIVFYVNNYLDWNQFH